MKFKKIFSGLLAAIMLASFVGCNKTEAPATDASTDQSSTSTSAPESQTESSKETEKETPTEGKMIKFTDSAGREVEIPENIERIAPSGPLAQVVLYTIAPDKMVGLASNFSEDQMKFVDKKYNELPVLGNLYGDTLNAESLILADPQVIVDIGEPKKTVVEDMDKIQEQTGIPTIFIHMELDTMADAYTTLGEVLGEPEQAKALSEYVSATLTEADTNAKAIKDEDRRTVLYVQDEGFTAAVKGTVHDDVIDHAGAVNVAEVESNLRGGLGEVSMEQILLWNPDVILFSPNSIYATVNKKPEWAEVEAVKNGTYYEIPENPYNWMGRPPSVNRLIGIKWLGNLLYPEVCQYDMVKETQEFYKLFYHADITEEQVNELLATSTLKPTA